MSCNRVRAMCAAVVLAIGLASTGFGCSETGDGGGGGDPGTSGGGGSAGGTAGHGGSSSSGVGGDNCEIGPWCTCGDTDLFHCLCSCSTDSVGAYPAELSDDTEVACLAHDGETCSGDGVGGADGTLTCTFSQLPWCGI